jgi:hypothetical protein
MAADILVRPPPLPNGFLGLVRSPWNATGSLGRPSRTGRLHGREGRRPGVVPGRPVRPAPLHPLGVRHGGHYLSQLAFRAAPLELGRSP